jgi:glycosyltransferase involved in cell wall biosynthesis
LPTDTALDIIRFYQTNRGLVVYYNGADFSYLTPQAKQLEKSERELVSISDLVFAMSSHIATKLSRHGAAAHVFPPGVDMSAFPAETSNDPPDRLGLAKLPRPIIGYVGGLHRFVDYSLVVAMARARPSWSWVFLGAHQASLDKLRGVPNIHLLGRQLHEDLAAHMHFFDVCIVPYYNTPDMSGQVPTKINEYLAAGKAIVATKLPAVCEFNALHGVLTTATPDVQDFLQAIESELPTAHEPSRRERRRQIAALADWQVRLEEMSGLIEEQLSTRA